jgi:hypothetical protein
LIAIPYLKHIIRGSMTSAENIESHDKDHSIVSIYLFPYHSGLEDSGKMKNLLLRYIRPKDSIAVMIFMEMAVSIS